MKSLVIVTLAAVACLAAGRAFAADPVREDVIWARSTNGAPITLDGVLDEPAWAQAESRVVRYGRVLNNGVPGSGSKEEGGILTKDSTFATIKFLVVGNQLYMGAVVRDSSVGGGRDFNRYDGFLMGLKDHSGLGHPAPVAEYLYSFWYQDSANGNPQPGGAAVGKSPGFGGRWATPPWGSPRTAPQIAAWDARTRVQGVSNQDTIPSGASVADTGYVVEMRFDLGVMGYDVTQAAGDIVEWNISIYDCDWFWWKNLTRMASNRAWWQSPWGNVMWYNEVRIHARPDVTISSGPVPAVGPELRIPNGAAEPTPVINGSLSDAVWSVTPKLLLRYGDDAIRDGYGNPMKYRGGQFQPTVNGGQAAVIDPANASVQWFFKGNTLYMGFDVNDEVVQNGPLLDRWDGFIVTIQDKAAKNTDRNLQSRRLTFHIGPGGAPIAEDYLPYLRDTLHTAQLGLQLKPGTTVDTTGNDFDNGYTAELSVDLTSIGYPAGLGDGALWIGVDLMDGDSYTPFTDSYGTRTWYGREYENECCPVSGFLDPALTLPLAVGDAPPGLDFTLVGNHPNPFRKSTTISFMLPRSSDVTLEVYDLLGRVVNRRAVGTLAPGLHNVNYIDRASMHSGVYLYRLRMKDPKTGGLQADLSGKMMLLE